MLNSTNWLWFSSSSPMISNSLGLTVSFLVVWYSANVTVSTKLLPVLFWSESYLNCFFNCCTLALLKDAPRLSSFCGYSSVGKVLSSRTMWEMFDETFEDLQILGPAITSSLICSWLLDVSFVVRRCYCYFLYDACCFPANFKWKMFGAFEDSLNEGKSKNRLDE